MPQVVVPEISIEYLNPKIANTPQHDFIAEIYEDRAGIFTADLRVQELALKELHHIIGGKDQSIGPKQTIQNLDHIEMSIAKATQTLMSIREQTEQIKASVLHGAVDGTHLDITAGPIHSDAKIKESRARLQKINDTVLQVINTLNSMPVVEITRVPLLDRKFSSAQTIEAIREDLNVINTNSGTTIGQIEEAIDRVSQVLKNALCQAQASAKEIRSYQFLEVEKELKDLEQQKKTVKFTIFGDREAMKTEVAEHNTAVDVEIRKVRATCARVQVMVGSYMAGLMVQLQLLSSIIAAKKDTEKTMNHVSTIIGKLKKDDQIDLLNRIIPTLGLPESLREALLIKQPTSVPAAALPAHVVIAPPAAAPFAPHEEVHEPVSIEPAHEQDMAGAAVDEPGLEEASSDSSFLAQLQQARRRISQKEDDSQVAVAAAASNVQVDSTSDTENEQPDQVQVDPTSDSEGEEVLSEAEWSASDEE